MLGFDFERGNQSRSSSPDPPYSDPLQFRVEFKDQISAHWLGKLVKLNPAQGTGNCQGKAPHKPLLLLAILDMAEEGEFLSPAFTRNPSLVLRFRCYGSIVLDRWPTKLDVKLPFFHLSSQGFWTPLDAEMRLSKSSSTCVVCEMHPQLFELLGDAAFRLKARMILISKYFAEEERVALLVSLGLEVASISFPETSRLMEDASESAKRKGRSASFPVRVCTGYFFTCALTGYRCTTSESASIVDAAHIESWSSSQNDDPRNGLALSKNAHWMFDEGLWSVDDNLRIIVRDSQFTESGPDAFRLASYRGRHLQFDPSSTLRPSLELCRKHRIRFGFGIRA